MFLNDLKKESCTGHSYDRWDDHKRLSREETRITLDRGVSARQEGEIGEQRWQKDRGSAEEKGLEQQAKFRKP
jgi:hypothetical protein